MKPLFISGIGTEIGKTVVSAIVVENMKADYWKPVQSGDLDNSDTDKVKRLISNSVSRFHPETYRLTQPFSPHKSADLDKIRIDMNSFTLPKTSNQLVIEGAGGLMVPLNEKDLMIDLIERLQAEVILVVSNYLGSINHTLLSINELKRRNIPVRAMIISGKSDEYSESFIINYSGFEKIIRIPQLESIDKESIALQASKIRI